MIFMKVTKLRKEILFAAMDIFKEQFENKEGKQVRVSTIEITLTKK